MPMDIIPTTRSRKLGTILGCVLGIVLMNPTRFRTQTLRLIESL